SWGGPGGAARAQAVAAGGRAVPGARELACHPCRRRLRGRLAPSDAPPTLWKVCITGAKLCTSVDDTPTTSRVGSLSGARYIVVTPPGRGRAKGLGLGRVEVVPIRDFNRKRGAQTRAGRRGITWQ